VRDTLRAGAANAADMAAAAVGGAAGMLATSKARSDLRDSIEHPGARWTLMPQRGRLLDRFLPVLILGALFFLATQQSGSSLWLPASPAVASNDTKRPAAASQQISPSQPSDVPQPPATDASR
jgi:hypothetical protein